MACWMNPVEHRRYPELSDTSLALGDLLPFHRSRAVSAIRAVPLGSPPNSRPDTSATHPRSSRRCRDHPCSSCTRLIAALALLRSTTLSIRWSSVLSVRFRASPSALRRSTGYGRLHPPLSSGSSSCLVFWRPAPSRLTVVPLSLPFDPSLRGVPVSRPGVTRACRQPVATMASADFSLRLPCVALSGATRDLPR